MKSGSRVTLGAACWLSLILVVGLFSQGCQHTRPNLAFSPLPKDDDRAAGEASRPYAVGDIITVSFPGRAEPIPAVQERIKEDGTINLPFIGSVKAAGKTPAEFQTEVFHLYVPRFTPRLTMIPPPDRRVYYMSGQVVQPGRYEYFGSLTVTKAIERAGGFTELAARKHVDLTRTDGKFFRINCDKAATTPSLDLPVYPGDKVNVPTTTPPGWRLEFESIRAK